jgi:[acyl-carrier-protein] S-malonyltransferase
MGKALFDASDRAREVFEEAEAALPGLKELCFEGPEEALVLTENTQPCVLAVDIAAFRAYGKTPSAAAGHSLGEYAALVAAGSLPFAEALTLVRERAMAMQKAVPAGVGGMVVLRKLSLEEAREVADSIETGVCDLANLNAPGQYVLSGEAKAMAEVVDKLGPRKALKLPVSVPFHSSLLSAAGEEFAKRLDQVSFRDPAFPIVCNVDAVFVESGDQARNALKRQFAGSVLWQDSMAYLFDQGYRRFLEFGPKATLSRMALACGRDWGAGKEDFEINALAICSPDDIS